MADDLTYSGSGASPPANTKQVTDEHVTRGHMPVVKLAYSADGDATLVLADANGLEVQLGLALPAGSNNIGDVDVLTIAAGDNNIGNVDIVTMPNVTLAAGTNTNEVVGDAAHDAAVAGNPLLMGGYASAAAPTAVDADGDAVRLWCLRNGAQAMVVTAAGALIGGDAAFGLDVDVTRVTGNVTVVNAGLFDVQVTGTATVANAGTFATQVDGAALTALQLIDDPVFADDAGFTVETSKVMVTGGLAVAHGSDPNALDAADAGAPIMNRHRVPFSIGGHPNVITVKHANITTAVTDVAIVTVGASNKIVVTRLTVTLDNASTVFPTVLIGFGATTTPTTTGVLYAHGGFPAGGGQTLGDGSGMLGVGADNEDLRITTTGNATGNGLQVTVSYFVVPT